MYSSPAGRFRGFVHTFVKKATARWSWERLGGRQSLPWFLLSHSFTLALSHTILWILSCPGWVLGFFLSLFFLSPKWDPWDRGGMVSFEWRDRSLQQCPLVLGILAERKQQT
jgi:hypothetical protein